MAPKPRKPRGPRPPTAIEAIWYDTWKAVRRTDPGKLAPHLAIALNRMHGEYGPDKLRAKITALLADSKKTGFATPKYLEDHWAEVAVATLFDDKWARISPKLLTEWKTVLSQGEPAQGSGTARAHWEHTVETIAKYRLTPVEVLGRTG